MRKKFLESEEFWEDYNDNNYSERSESVDDPDRENVLKELERLAEERRE